MDCPTAGAAQRRSGRRRELLHIGLAGHGLLTDTPCSSTPGSCRHLNRPSLKVRDPRYATATTSCCGIATRGAEGLGVASERAADAPVLIPPRMCVGLAVHAPDAWTRFKIPVAAPRGTHGSTATRRGPPSSRTTARGSGAAMPAASGRSAKARNCAKADLSANLGARCQIRCVDYGEARVDGASTPSKGGRSHPFTSEPASGIRSSLTIAWLMTWRARRTILSRFWRANVSAGSSPSP